MWVSLLDQSYLDKVMSGKILQYSIALLRQIAYDRSIIMSFLRYDIRAAKVPVTAFLCHDIGTQQDSDGQGRIR